MRSKLVFIIFTLFLVSCSQNLGTGMGAGNGSPLEPGPSSSSVPSGNSGGGSNITFSGGSD